MDEIIDNNSSYKRHSITDVILGVNNSVYGFKWKYKHTEPEIILQNDEIFKNIGTIDKYDFSLYNVSNYGKIINTKRKRYLKPAVNEKGYHSLVLWDKNTNKPINVIMHRIVAFVFVDGHSTEKNYVNHLDENKLNNYSKNLEWTSNRDNTIHSRGKAIDQIDIKTNEIIKTYKSLSNATKAMNSNNSSCIRGVIMKRQLIVTNGNMLNMDLN